MGKYHVVCHECPEEQVLVDREKAQELADEHEADADHRVSCEEIEAPMSEAQ